MSSAGPGRVDRFGQPPQASACFGSHADFFREGPYSHLRQEHRSAGTAPLRLFWAHEMPDGAVTEPPMPDYTVQLVTRGARGGVNLDFGAGRFGTDIESGTFVLSPPNIRCTYALGGRPDLLMVCMPVPVLEALAADTSGSGAQRDRVNLPPALHAGAWRDPSIEQICVRMWAEAHAGNPYGGLFADGAMLALTAALLRLSGLASERRHRGGLTPWQLRRATEAMDQAEGETPPLADLAALVGLSPAYFCTAFRQSTGTPPHAWQRARRVERAQGLLLHADLPVAEVALACGFANQSHFTRVFREVTGTTPARFRDAARL